MWRLHEVTNLRSISEANFELLRYLLKLYPPIIMGVFMVQWKQMGVSPIKSLPFKISKRHFLVAAAPWTMVCRASRFSMGFLVMFDSLILSNRIENYGKKEI